VKIAVIKPRGNWQ